MIINDYLYLYDPKKCKKFIIKDGINTDFFLIEKNNGIINEIKFHVISKKKVLLSIGKSISLIKNLDHYQNLICITLPDIPDTNPYKREFQKLRILIIGAFSKLAQIIHLPEVNEIDKWNSMSASLLDTVSNTVVWYRSKQTIEQSEDRSDKFLSLFEFFKLDIKKINYALDYLYL
jgi:hypothetical protein